MPRFVLFFFALWLLAALFVFSHDSFLIRSCAVTGSLDTCYAAIE